MKILRNIIMAVLSLVVLFMISTGFKKMTNIALFEYEVSEDENKMTLHVGVTTSMGYIRKLDDTIIDGEHHIVFYSTFGGINSSFGSKNEFEIDIEDNDTAVYFYSNDNEWRLILRKNEDTGIWENVMPERIIKSTVRNID